MRRDYVTLHVRPASQDGDRAPSIVLEYDGPADLLRERLEGPDGAALTADEIDVACRFQASLDADDPTGVFSLTDRLTGEFVLEANVAADRVLDLVSAARAEDDPGGESGGCYRIELREGDETWTYEKETLLVYDDEGSLLRQHSLIPSGVEL